MQEELIRPIKPVLLMPTYGCSSMLYLFKMLRFKQGGSTIFKVFGMTRPGFEPPASQTQSRHSNHYTTEYYSL